MLLVHLSNQFVSRQLEVQEVSPFYKSPIQVLLAYFLHGKKIHLTTTCEIEPENEVLSKKPCFAILYGQLPSTLHSTQHTQ